MASSGKPVQFFLGYQRLGGRRRWRGKKAETDTQKKEDEVGRV